MSLTDLMSAQRLESFAEIGMIMFLGIFIAVAWRTFGSRSDELEAARLLPLADDDHRGSVK
ncbi:MAG: hypothetical protein HY791_23995 [Deltaproteobacteria bacterium]|nr:hypothetical protein [Deltaproteobacteria bacterium]